MTCRSRTKALYILDEAGARVSLKSARRRQVTARDIEELVAGIARIPVKSLTSGDKEHLRTLEEDLTAAVLGQQKAIHSKATAVKAEAERSACDQQKPGGFLLYYRVLPGSGKTELCRVLARTARR